MPEQLSAEDLIKQTIADADDARQRVIDERDARIRELVAEHQLRQIDLTRITGWSRETARQVLDPAAKERARQATADRRAAAK